MAALGASMVVKPLVSMVMQKASSSLLDQYKVMEGMEEQHEKLKLLLPAVMDVITDAEKQATHRAGVRFWLQKLKTAAYESIEVFDEFKYEALRRQAKKEGRYIKLGMDVIKLFPSHNRIAFRYRMGNKLCKIVRDIEALVKQMNDFGYNSLPQVQRPVHPLREDTSFIQDPDIVSRSRYEEKQKIVRMLVNDQANKKKPMVIPIVGMGGLGKTTLAQLIFNDPQVQNHFQLLKWVCVSDAFDVCNLANKICDAPAENNLEKALQNLKKEINGKRYLLVLDDVWNEDVDKWAKLKACLEHGDAGSAVLITTRGKRVAQLMSTGTDHDIAVLDKKYIKDIIERRAFSLLEQESKPVELLDLVDEMANRCLGSPLAAKALGAVLCKKTVQEWKSISEASSICSDETGILPILKLSYDDLPADMKQCFAFCAVFPKDFKIDVDMLIQLWMAIGFIAEHYVGKRIFNELVSRSFFQDVEEFRVLEDERRQGYRSRTICKIHDLMHDVALSVMEGECVAIIEESSSISGLLTNKARHMLLTSSKAVAILNRSMKEISPNIQTLLRFEALYGDLQHVSKYSSLRALKLRVPNFPMQPIHLHHLRYLDLSNSSIKALPEDIGILYNLQTLNLSGCKGLVRLPNHMSYMTALRHLYICGCVNLKFMPLDLGRLISLQTLTNFVAGIGSDCSDLGELQNLNIGGSLVLNQLENVTEAAAKVANLGDKKELRELSLIWTSSETDEHHSPQKVLEGLKFPDELQALSISSYQGTTFPTWMGMLQNMVELYLYDCNECEKLPPLCKVPALQVLCLCRLEKLQCLYSSGGTSFTFPKLKDLTLTELQNFEVWCEINWGCEKEMLFPDLEKLIILRCPKLIALPNPALATESCGQDNSMAQTAFPSLKILELKNLETFQRWEAIEATKGRHISFPQLEELSVWKCPKLVALPEAPLLGEPYGQANTLGRSSFPALKVLNLKVLETFQRWEAVDTTQERQIIFPRLEELEIWGCPELTALPAGTLLGASAGHDDTTAQSAFPELKRLNLYGLYSFKSWGVTEGTFGERPSFPKLEEAEIQKCPELTSLPEASKLNALKIGDGVNLTVLWEIQQLNPLKISDGVNLQVFLEIHRFLHSLSKLALSFKETKATFPSDADSTFEWMHGMEKCDHESPLEVMELRHCDLFFWSSALALWSAFVQIRDLEISCCSMLVCWPEKEFERLVSLRKLYIRWCKNLVGDARAPDDQPTSERIQLLPHLESLKLECCDSLVELFNLPPSLKRMVVTLCPKLGKLQGRATFLNHGRPTSDVLASTAVQEPSSSATDHHFLPPCLEELYIYGCGSLTEVGNLPPTLRELTIVSCDNIQHLSGRLDLGGLLSLEGLRVEMCKSLASLPDGPQAYSSLRHLIIIDCPRLKSVPSSLQRRLPRLEGTILDARYEARFTFPCTACLGGTQ